MSRLPGALWQRGPAAAGRVWPTAAYALADGSYLLRWPRLAVAIPAAGVILGMVLGAAHAGPIYSYSFAVTAAMVAAAGFGGGVGFWVLSGFIVADLMFSDRSSLPGFASFTAVPRLAQGIIPLAMSYLLLALLLVLVPLAGSGFAVVTSAALRGANAASAVLAASFVYVGAVAGLTYAWAQAMPFMIRPLWSFTGNTPDTAAVQPIQGNTAGLCAIAAAAAIGRCLLIRIGAGTSRWPPLAPPGMPRAGGRSQGVRAVTAVPFQALFLTLLLGGLISSIWQGAVTWLLVCVVLAARLVAVPLIPVYPDLVRRVPLLLRIGACALLSYFLGSAIVQPAVDQGETSFAPMLIATLGSLAGIALLLPGPRMPLSGRRSNGEQRSLRQRGRSPPAGPPHSAGVPFTAAGWSRLGRLLVVVLVVQLLVPTPNALADNCSEPSDCSTGVKIALVVAAIVGIAILVVLLPEIVAPVVEPLAGAIAADEAAAAGAIAAAAEIVGLDAQAVVNAATSELVSAEAAIAEGISPRLGPILTAIQEFFNAAPTTSDWDALAMVGRAVASVGFEPGTMLGRTAAGSFVFMHPASVVSFMFTNGQVLVMQGPRAVLNLIP
jgi:hypothetical protein